MAGEDVGSAFIVDCGTLHVQAGYAGEQWPRHSAYSAVGQGVDGSAATMCDEGENLPWKLPKLRHPLYCSAPRDWDVRYCWPSEGLPPLNGSLADFSVEAAVEASAAPRTLDEDAYTGMVDRIFNKEGIMQCPLKGELILVSEFNDASAKSREIICEILLESFEAEGFFAAPRASLSCFASGRQTGVVVDVGAGGTSIAPVVEGYLLRRGLRKWPIGGDVLDAKLLRLLQAEDAKKTEDAKIGPTWWWAGNASLAMGVWTKSGCSRRSGVQASDSWSAFCARDVLRRLREDHCLVADAASSAAIGSIELPDGTELPPGKWNTAATECLFEFAAEDAKIVSKFEDKSLPAAVANLITKCDVECRKDLIGNLLFVGGVTAHQGFVQRMTKQLQECESLGNSASRVKTASPAGTAEKRFAAWLGGSMLGSLGTFQQLWVSRAELKEFGAQILSRRCNL